MFLHLVRRIIVLDLYSEVRSVAQSPTAGVAGAGIQNPDVPACKALPGLTLPSPPAAAS